MRTLFFVTVLLLFIIRATAQNTSPGFYISTKGEKVPGIFNEYRQWINNPSSVVFEKEDKTSVILTPENCASFTVSGYDTYVARKLVRMTTSNDISKALFMESTTDTYDTGAFFLRKIFELPSITVYEYIDKARENYFIQTDDGFSELIHKVAFSEGKAIEDKRYITQLQTLLASLLEGDKKIEKKLMRMDYTERSIVSFLNDVYKTKGSVDGARKKYPVELVLGGGVSFNKIDVSPYVNTNPRTFVNYTSSVAPVVSMGVVDYSQRNFGKYFLSFNLAYTSFNHVSDYYGRGAQRWTYKSNVVWFSAGAGIRWINKKDFSWYTSLLPSLLFLFNNKEIEDYNGGQDISKGRIMSVNAGLQTGIVYKQFSVWAQYNTGIPAHNFQLYDPVIKSVFAGIGWRKPLTQRK